MDLVEVSMNKVEVSMNKVEVSMNKVETSMNKVETSMQNGEVGMYLVNLSIKKEKLKQVRDRQIVSHSSQKKV